MSPVEKIFEEQIQISTSPFSADTDAVVTERNDGSVEIQGSYDGGLKVKYGSDSHPYVTPLQLEYDLEGNISNGRFQADGMVTAVHTYPPNGGDPTIVTHFDNSMSVSGTVASDGSLAFVGNVAALNPFPTNGYFDDLSLEMFGRQETTDIDALKRQLAHDENILKNAKAGYRDAQVAFYLNDLKALVVAGTGAFANAVLPGVGGPIVNVINGIVDYVASGASSDDTTGFIISEVGPSAETAQGVAEASGIANKLTQHPGAVSIVSKIADAGSVIYNLVLNNSAQEQMKNFYDTIKLTEEEIQSLNSQISELEGDQSAESSSPSVPALSQRITTATPDSRENKTKVPSSFVYLPTSGADMDRHSQLGEAKYDALALPSPDFIRMADVMRHSFNHDSDAVINGPITSESLSLLAMTKGELEKQSRNFTFV